ncbi:MAG: UDP-N-acetylmuramoyl-L-alanine--D-glutamate ligase, partial [Oscillospiraceae bacterium]|nr:UDP-N-acetylmuramoyl-L-alanine--D-glutamate ligase [Oscillospiraceae bacterium]
MTLQEYLSDLHSKRVAVIGVGVSNTPLIELLLDNGISVTACDRSTRDKFGDLAERLENKGAELRLGDDYLSGLDHDVIFKTPGMRPDIPQLIEAKKRGSVITSEMEVFFDVCPCKIVAVTGSDGKTTTTTIIAKLLEAAGYTVHLGGNIGKPLLAEAGNIKVNDYAVVELSSFQLMTMKRSANISVVTNIAPNHLDYHIDMEEYTLSKKNIYAYQSADDLLVLNADNDVTAAAADEAKGELRMFSRLQKIENGCWFDGDAIIFNGREIVKRKDIKLPGLHNVENYMAAFAAVIDIVGDDVCRRIAAEFGGV